MRSHSPFPSTTARALMWFCVIVAAIYFAPLALGKLEPSRGPTADDGRGEEVVEGEEGRELPSVASLAKAMLGGASSPQSPSMPAILASGGAAGPASEGTSETVESDVSLEDPSNALASFYKALERTTGEESDELTRIIHYGDSMLTGDKITDAARRVLQERFGDGGHGFVLPGRPWPWYRHCGVNAWNSNGFRVNRITANPTSDGYMGLGAVSFRTFQGGARFMVEPVDGELVSRFELFYLAQPRGGDLTLTIDGAVEEAVSTRADRPMGRTHAIEVPEGAHRLTVSYAGNGEVRVFGVVLERPGPGVVYDSLGVNGLHARNFERFAPRHLADQINLRSPDLIIVMLGTNESQNQYLDLDRHGEEYAALLSRLRDGGEEVSCLIMSPPDRVLGEVGTRRALMASIVARQREVALENGCAFWNTFEAMGGRGSAESWRRHDPPLLGGDLTHPTPAGAERIGSQVAQALIAGFEHWRDREAAPSDERM